VPNQDEESTVRENGVIAIGLEHVQALDVRSLRERRVCERHRTRALLAIEGGIRRKQRAPI
jgi:hypothetical protein